MSLVPKPIPERIRAVATSWSEFVLAAFIVVRPSLDLLAGMPLVSDLNVAALLTLGLTLPSGWLIWHHWRDLTVPSVPRNFTLLFMLFFFAAALSWVPSDDIRVSSAHLLRLVSFLIILIAAWLHFVDRKSRRLLLWMFLSAVVPLALGFYQWLCHRGNLYTPGYNRIIGPFPHPNVYAQYLLVMAILIFLAWRLLRPSGWRKVVLAGFGIVVLFQMYKTFSRSSWIALAMAAVTYGILGLVRGDFILKPRHLVLPALVLLLLSGPIQTRWKMAFSADPGRVTSLNYRLKIWQTTWEHLGPLPLLGQGAGMHPVQFGEMAHNDYLKVLYENGFVGLFFYLLPFLFLALNALRKSLILESSRKSVAYKGIFIVLAVFLLISGVDNLQRSLVVMLYLFFAVAWLFNTAKETDRSSNRG